MASERILEEKKLQVQELADQLKAAETIVLAEYLGLTVAQDTDLRTKLRDSGVTYKVVKNNIGKRAVEEAGLEGLAEHFVGPTAIAYSDDVVAPAKVLKDFSKNHEIFKLKAGASNGNVLSDEKLNALASVPGLDELHARLARGIAWPLTHLAMLVKSLSEKLEEEGGETAADVVEAKADSAEEAGAEVTEETTEEAQVEAEAQAEEVTETEEVAEAAEETATEETAEEAVTEEATEEVEEAKSEEVEAEAETSEETKEEAEETATEE